VDGQEAIEARAVPVISTRVVARGSWRHGEAVQGFIWIDRKSVV